MCSANINMGFKAMHRSKEILYNGTYNDGDYFKLDDEIRKLVDDKAD